MKKQVIEKGQLTVTSVDPNKYNSSQYQAELKQTIKVKTVYTGKEGGTDLQDSLTDDEFVKKQEYSSEQVRVAWVGCNPTDTVESVAAKLAKYPEANIYRISSLYPILDDNQRSAIKAGIGGVTVDTFAGTQLSLAKVTDENGETQLALRTMNGYPVYTRTLFSLKGKEDVNMIEEDFAEGRFHTSDFVNNIVAEYVSKNLVLEMNKSLTNVSVSADITINQNVEEEVTL